MEWNFSSMNHRNDFFLIKEKDMSKENYLVNFMIFKSAFKNIKLDEKVKIQIYTIYTIYNIFIFTSKKMHEEFKQHYVSLTKCS